MLWGGVAGLGCWVALSLGCSGGEAPSEPVGRTLESIVSAARSEVGRAAPPPDHERERRVTEAVRLFEASRPRPAPALLPISIPTERPNPEGGIPQDRFLSEAELALARGWLVADISFIDRGEVEEYPPGGVDSYRLRMTRYRVRVNETVRIAGRAIPRGEFDLFTHRAFVPPRSSSEGSPRIIAVIGDQSFRPGYNLLMGVSVSSESATLEAEAFGAAAGAPAIDVINALRRRAEAIVAAGGVR